MESIDNVSVNSEDICSNFINILDTVFKDCPDGVVYKDNTLCYRMANSAFCKYYGIKDKQDYIGKRDMKFLSSENQKLIFDISHTILEEKRPLSFVMSLNNKSNVVLSVTSSPIYFEDVFLGIISIIKDITQEESLKEEFVNKHYEYINSERKLQAQRETFVASLGHDLKNPTIAQIRSLELLLKGSFGEISQEQGEIIEMVLDSCRYMNGMLSTLLATYRNQGGVVKLNFAEFSLPDLVNECVSEMIYVAKDKGVNITVVDNTSENIIQADRVQIKRVIMNLLSNGIKYAFSNTDLNLQIYGIKNMIGFEFMNESPYIPEERRKSLFAQYVSYASAHNELGIGLGLYASKKIIDGHNGKIFVESYKNNRNTFGFRIPIVQKNNLSDKFIQF